MLLISHLFHLTLSLLFFFYSFYYFCHYYHQGYCFYYCYYGYFYYWYHSYDLNLPYFHCHYYIITLITTFVTLLIKIIPYVIIIMVTTIFSTIMWIAGVILVFLIFLCLIIVIMGPYTSIWFIHSIYLVVHFSYLFSYAVVLTVFPWTVNCIAKTIFHQIWWLFYLLFIILNVNVLLFIGFYTVLYKKNCKNNFVQITKENIRPKYFFSFWLLHIYFPFHISKISKYE